MNNKGQIALVVLVISAIVMTIGLSVSKKTVVETKLTTDEESLKQAFNVAESGIEYYLGTGQTQFVSSDSKSQADITFNTIGGGVTIANNGGSLTMANNVAYTWLVDHDAAGLIDLNKSYQGVGLTLCVDNDFGGSLKVDYFYKESVNGYQVKRLGYNVSGSLVTNYTSAASTITCPGLVDARGISLDTIQFDPADKPILLTVKPIGDSTRINILSSGGIGASFPTQGTEVKSLGKVGDVAAGVTVNRNIRIVNQYFVPAFMLDAITAGNVVRAQ